jgi:hypothetical protein
VLALLLATYFDHLKTISHATKQQIEAHNRNGKFVETHSNVYDSTANVKPI